ncbi:DegT/DnrJ/EryC1/StrS family aminotransferase [Aliivibrio fischeri]|uniref:DegT/DnrJ/EryC1/StrS family aminotransferase n=1 Tax=Aliivibrio fischeri TaxID=668 RepID=UPI00080DDE39|nr:DegT/DnrJ/EryC1/StrS family aminotransferase [Aliivibrio fischeri]OCH34291.1 pyridoxal-5'-phosphate-dependent protein [Aliivibrio fischeri]OED52105.1 pyridoxal-5'-phosphate-dependent protein [Aliivibrio fischeri]
MIPLIRTFMPPKDELMPELEKVLYSGYINQGVVVDDFEKELATYLGNSNCLTVNSGTAALHIALILAGVKEGDEVISTALTAEPTNTVIKQTGAKIVWADIDLKTGNLSPEDVERKITNKTKAIMVVDYAGIPMDIKKFQEIEKKYGIPIIEDGAHAFGASFAGKKIGNHFKYTIFSFQAIKHLTTVDGGVLCIANNDEFEKAKLIRWFGISKNVTRKENDISVQGYKYHMNNVNATVGLVQLKHISSVVSKYIENGKFFDEALKNIPNLELLEYYPDSQPSYWLYTVKVKNKQAFIDTLNAKGIMASDLHKRNDLHTIFNESMSSLPNLDQFENEWVHIPCGWWVTEEDREYIVRTIKEGW